MGTRFDPEVDFVSTAAANGYAVTFAAVVVGTVVVVADIEVG